MTTSLSHSPAHITAVLLVAQGMGVTPPAVPWPIYATNEPDTPDDVVTVFDTAGMVDGSAMIDGWVPEHYGIQIRLRSKEPKSGYAKLSSIVHAIDEVIYNSYVIIDSKTYCVKKIHRKGSIIALGKEVAISKRNLFTVNATVSLVAS